MADAPRERTMATVYADALADLFEDRNIRSADMTIAQREAVHLIMLRRELIRQQNRLKARHADGRYRAA